MMCYVRDFFRVFGQKLQNFFSEGLEHTAVTALLIDWKENDVGGLANEMCMIRELMRQN